MNIRPAATFCAFILAAFAFAACDENKGGGGTTTSTTSASATTTASATTSATTITMATDSATTTATASAAPSATDSAAPSATASTGKTTATAATTAATASAGTVASAAPSDSAGGAAACGGKDQPKCPLQAWMASNMQPAMASKDAAKLAAALRASAKFAPPGYGDWAKYANDGAAAVDASKDVADGKASCKNCHGAYQKRYRTEMRDRKI